MGPKGPNVQAHEKGLRLYSFIYNKGYVDRGRFVVNLGSPRRKGRDVFKWVYGMYRYFSPL